MNTLVIMLGTVLSLAAFGGEAIPALGATNAAGPSIQFDSTTYEFGQALAGEPVKHAFTFTNAGARDLSIKDVQPGCGCTKAGEWTRLVQPGETGVIPLQLNTGGLSGRVERAVKVICNDPAHAVMSLRLRGAVRRALEMRPSVALLKLLADSPFGMASIRITNYLEQPLLLTSLQSTNRELGAELRTNIFGRDYEVIISNTVPLPPGQLTANIALKTSLTNLPILNIVTLANVCPTFTVMPDQISLSAEAGTKAQLAYVSILYHGTNRLSLCQPRVSGGGVVISLKETQPGKAFTAMLSFPAGFKLPPGPSNAFSVLTTHPLYPLLQVRICQTSNPIPAAPLLSRTPFEMATAPLPLIFQTAALNSLKLSQEQQEAIDELRKQFIEQVGGPGQDPCDPAYLGRWKRAQPHTDALLTEVIGQRALMRFDLAPVSESGSQ
jgi:hypothetical protein